MSVKRTARTTYNAAIMLLLIVSALLASAQTAKQDQPEQWRKVAAENTVYLDTPDGRILIELNPAFAPKTVAQFKRLVHEKFYTGLHFYRVIDGFVAQGGDGSDLTRELSQPTLPAEFEQVFTKDMPFVSAQKNDLFAAETGFINGFPAARDAPAKTVWLTHCPGVIAMARDTDPASGSTDFYFVIGQAPRYLDRNLTIFGRVIMGMDVVQQINRGTSVANGIITSEADQTPILQISLATDIPTSDRLAISVMDTNHPVFERLLSSRRQRAQEFFQHHPPEVLDVCQVPIPIRVEE